MSFYRTRGSQSSTICIPMYVMPLANVCKWRTSHLSGDCSEFQGKTVYRYGGNVSHVPWTQQETDVVYLGNHSRNFLWVIICSVHSNSRSILVRDPHIFVPSSTN
jgi:hypothetical protein